MTFPSRTFPDPRHLTMRLSLPYGMWTCSDGRQVLFNREYQPIWQRPNAYTAAQQADPKEWVHYKTTIYFFDDGNSPWDEQKMLARCWTILKRFIDGDSVEKYEQRPAESESRACP